jgi:hypothetical protein
MGDGWLGGWESSAWLAGWLAQRSWHAALRLLLLLASAYSKCCPDRMPWCLCLLPCRPAEAAEAAEEDTLVFPAADPSGAAAAAASAAAAGGAKTRRQSDSHPLAQLERLVLSPMLPAAAAKGKGRASKGKGQKRKSGGTPAGAAAAASSAGGGSGRGMLVVILDELDSLLTSAPPLHKADWLLQLLLAG